MVLMHSITVVVPAAHVHMIEQALHLFIFKPYLHVRCGVLNLLHSRHYFCLTILLAPLLQNFVLGGIA